MPANKKQHAEKRTLNPAGSKKSKRGQEPNKPVEPNVGQFTAEGGPGLQKK